MQNDEWQIANQTIQDYFWDPENYSLDISYESCENDEDLEEHYLYWEGLIQIQNTLNYDFEIYAETTGVPIGEYCVSIVAKDDLSQSVRVYVVLTVENEPPSLSAGNNQFVMMQNEVEQIVQITIENYFYDAENYPL